MKGTKSKSFDEISLTVDDLPALRRKRTMALNRLRKTLEIAELAQKDTHNLDKFLTYYAELQKNVTNFESAHSDILSLIEDESENTEDVVRSTFDDCYFDVMCIYRKLFKTSDHTTQPSVTQFGDEVKVNLPKITLPNFSGNIKSWPEFYDIFNSMIHESKSLSDSERMQYLVSCLSGDALALIRTFPATGTYYQAAYKMLIDRYRDSRDLAFTCWKEMLNVNLKSKSPHDFRRTLDTFNENLTILTRLKLPTDQWDFILCYLLLSKLDPKLRCSFEQTPAASEFPTYDSLKSFLYTHCDALVRDNHFSNTENSQGFEKLRPSNKFHEAISKKHSSVLLSNADDPTTQSLSVCPPERVTLQGTEPSPTVSSYKCSFCGEGHSIKYCKSFAQKSIQDRLEHAKKLNWCFNCLKSSHSLKDCKSIFNCQKCRKRHHTLLHLDKTDVPETESVTNTNTAPTCSQVSAGMLTNDRDNHIILLSTAKIEIRDSSGQFQTFRALIDSGSQAHFITEQAATRLGLRRSSTARSIRGLGQSPTAVSGAIQLEIGTGRSPVFNVEALVLENICGKMPIMKLDTSRWKHLQHLTLADPECNVPGNIDVLLGAEVFSSLLLPGSVSGTSDQPSALNSIFGWLLMGNVGVTCNTELNSFFISDTDRLTDQVRKFWELDSLPGSPSKLTSEEERCEQLFQQTVSRTSSGRYIVNLPFKEELPFHDFPGSRDTALKRFHSLERKLAVDANLNSQYSEFMADYLRSGHMSLVPIQEIKEGRYYIPHHCILRPDSATTKLRVVFDASAKDTRGVSLNDTLMTGQKLQTNIMDVLFRFRAHFIVFTADVRQMYRQILVHEEDRDYQRIFWRFNRSEPVQEYRLNTVTYGVSSAPFLACRTLKQLIQDEGSDLPLATNALLLDVYVDDVVSGARDLDNARRAKSEVIELFNRGNLELRKWASNHPDLLKDLPSEHCLTDCVSLDTESSSILKILGLKWNPSKDVFTFEVKPLNRTCTKRSILSELARIFDPLGFLAPLTFLAKCLVQRLWMLNVDWDDPPPAEILLKWECFSEQLTLLRSLEIPRCIAVSQVRRCQFHGFADSSEAGYGAVVYLRVVDIYENTHIFFICAKSRVAPTKRISLPRLELCAAVILADLLKYVKDVYSNFVPCCEMYAWSDSTVTLSWLRSPSYRWKTFVANRVSHIQETLPDVQWNHVPSRENPADIASRGQLPADLLNNSLWWAGPAWLLESPDEWPSSRTTELKEDPVSYDEERVNALLVHIESSFIDELLAKHSSIKKTQRIIAYCRRFIHNTRNRNKESRPPDHFLTHTELHDALLVVVKHVQAKYFHDDLNRLTANKLLPKQIRKLNPFIDEQGVLRVGGRLSRSGLEFEHKHPALLPKDARLTYQIIESIHQDNCHPGINTMQYLLTQQFWIISPKRAIRHVLSKCLRCFRTRPTPLEPFMSDLPAARVNQVKPFSLVGVDYGGPFRIKFGSYRGAKLGKAYLCLFVCFATKALHLEAASDLSSEAFIAALRRFVGRRGRVEVIHSDCGTNFVGANNIFAEFMKEAAHSQGVEFRFNPPASPHFGGVWEIQIKAVKSHLHRIVGDQTLTFEELTTLFVQIESMLNSRPLCPLSSDPNDLNVLTPGHFLTLEPLTSLPDKDLTPLKINRLGRWQLVQRFQQDFWKRWRNEYLQTLTQRAKWTTECRPLDVNSIVIVKSENTIPLHWPLARVVELHSGPDGIVRLATVKTANGALLKRPLVKLCPLPNQID